MLAILRTRACKTRPPILKTKSYDVNKHSRPTIKLRTRNDIKHVLKLRVGFFISENVIIPCG